MTPSISGTSSGHATRLGRISFINVDPIYYGFDTGRISENIEVVSAPPAGLNRMLAEGSLDISAVSSAAYGFHHREWLLLPDPCIACRGDVMSVLLVGRRPLKELSGKRVLVTDDSATAVNLMRLMFAHRGITPALETRKVQAPSMVDDDAQGALVIGDAALRHDWHSHFEFVWDLGDLWARLAGLPFVFAVWAVRRAYAEAHPVQVKKTMEMLSRSRRMGISALDDVVRTASLKLGVDAPVIERYFNNFLFNFDRQERSGLEAFFDDLHDKGIFSERVPIRFF